MANSGGNNKGQRKHKVSQGIHGATRHPLSELEKALLGKGMFQSFIPVGRDPRTQR